jgi:tyrosine-protein kinase Etk/Wzc
MNTRNGSAPPAASAPAATTPALAHDAPSLDVTSLLVAIRRGWWIIVLSFIACLGLGVLFTLVTKPTFSAYSVVYVNTATPGSSSLESQMLGIPDRNLANEIEILHQSVPLAEQVAALVMGKDSTALASRDPAIVRRAEEFLNKKKVVFEPLDPRVDMIKITAESGSPREAANIANTYAELYRERGISTSRASVSNARAFLEQQVAERRAALADAETDLGAYLTREGAVNLDQEGTQVVAQAASVDAAIQDALVEMEVAQTALRALEEEAGQVFPDLADRVASGVVQQISALQQQIVAAEIRAGEYYAVNPALRGNESQNPELAAIVRQIGEMRQRVDALSQEYVDELRSSGGVDPTVGGPGLSRVGELHGQAVDRQIEIRGLETKIAMLRQRQAANEARMHTLPAQSLQVAQLQRNAQANEDMYLSMLQQLQDLRVTEEGELGYIEIIREAAVPKKPVSPKPLLNLLLGAVMGIFVGIGLAFFRHANDHLLRTPEDLEAHGFTLLGGVPLFDRLVKEKFGGRRFVEVEGREVSSLAVAALHPLSPVTETFRHLRTSVLFSLPDRPIRTLLVTSPEPAEGKSTIAIDLAIAFTQAGRRVLYVDADLRKPTGHTLLGLPREGGLADLLFNDGPVNWEAYHHPLRVDWGSFESEAEGLYVLTAGQAVPNPTELLGSQKMRECLTEAGAHFDLVVVDSAPFLAVAEARLLAADCDAVVLVARVNQTSLRAMRQTRRALEAVEPEGARFIGVIANGIEKTRRQGGYGGYAGYGYAGYGYGAYGYGYGMSDADFGSFEGSGDGAAGEPRVAKATRGGLPLRRGRDRR